MNESVHRRRPFRMSISNCVLQRRGALSRLDDGVGM
jgi:hypothetical protein